MSPTTARAPMSLIRLLLIVPMLFFAAPPAQAHFERAELEQMLAPIALYPDSVLSHVLIAATYPDQVAEAARWSDRHPDLQGEAAVDAVEKYDWDPSVKALVAFPEVLARMDEDPDWTDQLGEAFLDQEGEVMDAVQHLRTRAYDAGRLDSLDNVRVVREREYIYIEPAVHGVIFVPYYDPWWVYGSWWWPHYPPYMWTTWYGRPVRHYGSSWYWGIGFHVRPAFYFTTFHWPARHVVVTHRYDRPLYSGRDAPRHREVRHWRQEPAARRHAERPSGVDRREARGNDRAPERRDDRSTERRSDRRDEPREERRDRQRGEQRDNRRPDVGGGGRRNERQQRGREPAASLNSEPADDARADGRRERMERGRQQRDAAREQRSTGANATRGRGSAEREKRRREADREQPNSHRQQARPEQREAAVPRNGAREGRRDAAEEHSEEAQGRRPEAQGRPAESQGYREESRGRREEAQARREGGQREEAQERREESSGPRDSGERAQGRQNRDKGERERSQREERSR